MGMSWSGDSSISCPTFLSGSNFKCYLLEESLWDRPSEPGLVLFLCAPMPFCFSHVIPTSLCVMSVYGNPPRAVTCWSQLLHAHESL